MASRILIGRVLNSATDSVDVPDLELLLGEVQASPTANTVLARLKDILSLVVLAAGSNEIGITRDSVTAETIVRFDRYEWTGPVSNQTLWTPTASKRFVLTDLLISVSAACEVAVTDGNYAASTIIFEGLVAEYGGLVYPTRKPYASAAINTPLKLTTSNAGGWIVGWGYETT